MQAENGSNMKTACHNHTFPMNEFNTARFIDPLTDFGFKRIFGSEPNKDLLIDFLNQLFLGERQVVDLVYNKNEHSGPLADHRKAIFDLLCTGSNGEQFIIEVQRVKQEYFKDRCLFYTSSLIRDQAPSGAPGWDYQLKPVYLIGLMDFTFDEKNTEHYVHRVQLMNTNTAEKFYDKLGFTFIELPKFEKTETELVSELDYWFFLLRNLSKLDKIPLFLRKPVFSKLFNVAEVSNLNREDKMAYDSSLKQKWDLQNSFDYVEKEGFEKGVTEGRLEGKKQEKLNIARNMKAKGLDFVLISELLDLPVETIEKL